MAENLVSRILARPRLVASLLALASAALLAGAFWFQFVVGLQPCELCIAQRWAHGAAIAMALVVVGFATRRRAGALLGLLGLVYVVSTAIAAYHVGVEHHLFRSAFCGGGASSATTVEALKAQLMATGVARCDQIVWSLAGITMAGYNALISAALAIAAFVAAVRNRRAGRS